jgi:hypothetical protein
MRLRTPRRPGLIEMISSCFLSPLIFQVTLTNPNGTVVNSLTLFGNTQIMQLLPHPFKPSIVLAKSNAAVESISF